MRYLEIRRHTMRVKPGKHLSQAGVDLARRVGETMGAFDRVFTSKLPRAFETALALGYAVDKKLKPLGEMGWDVDGEGPVDGSFKALNFLLEEGGEPARFAQKQASLWLKIVSGLPEEGRALIISHGGIIEAGAVACLPEADHSAWGEACSYCEGVKLSFDGKEFSALEVLRVKS